ncbi:MAG: methyltransferase domain-containing protein [Verrucomicrobia bacterium]|nr:methyltransferase domain-containing protein [Verrucomicrobiota bacterium]
MDVIKKKNVIDYTRRQESLTRCRLCQSSQIINSGLETFKDEDYLEWVKKGFTSSWAFCEECGCLFTKDGPPADCLEDYYAESLYRTSKSQIVIDEGWWTYSHNQFTRFEKWLEFIDINILKIKKGKILDYGCGLGAALHKFKLKNWKCFGYEIDKTLSRFAEKTFGLQSIDPKTENELKFDIIFSHHVYEHMANPNELLDFAGKRLNSQGFLLLVTPSWRFANNQGTLKAISLMDTVLIDHCCLAFQASSRNLHLKAVLYQNICPGTDWEMAAVLCPGERENKLPIPDLKEVEETFKKIKNSGRNLESKDSVTLITKKE